MDGRHPNEKPRPKRRKAEDNPYTLSEMVDTASMSHYYISFIDGQGRNTSLEISQELFATFDRFELDDLSFLNEVDNHYEHSELTEATLNARALHKPETVEDYLFSVFSRQKPQQPQKLHPLLREELLKLERISKEARLLAVHHIDTDEQLSAYKAAIEERQQILPREKWP